MENLKDTVKGFFHMIFQFAKLKSQKNQIKIIIVEDQLQELITDTCGIFQLYFHENLFNPLSDSKIINDEFQQKKKKNNRNIIKQNFFNK